MTRKIRFVFILLVCSARLASSNPLIALSVDEILRSTNEITDSLHNLLDKTEKDLNSEESIKVFKYLEDIHKRCHSLHNRVDFKIDDLKNDLLNAYAQVSTVSTALDERLLKLFEYSVSIKGFFEVFLKFAKTPKGYNDIRRGHFFTKMTEADPNSLNDLLNKINDLYFNKNFRNPSLISLLVKNVYSILHDYKLSKSPHQLLYDFLRSLLYVQIEGYIIQKYSYMYLEKIGQGDTKHDLIDLEKKFEKNINTALFVFKNLMAVAPKEVWIQYPNQHIEGTTYEELKYVFQRFITNELNINPKDQCKNQCKDYSDHMNSSECTLTQDFCLQSQCRGRLHECSVATVAHDCPSTMFNNPCRETEFMSSLTVCPSQTYRQDHFSHRRFDYVIYNGTALGTLGSECSVEPVVVETTYKGSLGLPVNNPCDMCGCICEDFSDLSERYFSLDPVQANTAENYVITGARFVKKDKIVFIQIQEGKLTPYGEIDPSTVHWVKLNEKPQNLYQLEWENRREIELYDLMAPKGYVITEISFGVTHAKNYQQRLILKASSRSIDFHGGKLRWSTEILKNNEFERYELNIPIPDIPIRYAPGEVVYSQNNDFVRFGVSDFTEDFGQSTVPFIDVREVTTNPPVPMSGVGIYLSRGSNDAGFLSLRLFTFDYDSFSRPNVVD